MQNISLYHLLMIRRIAGISKLENVIASISLYISSNSSNVVINIVTSLSVTIDGVWIGDWIYWTF
jgi:CRISPR/Cas system endoribonuclease Cas6 (RAMP superfamily)